MVEDSSSMIKKDEARSTTIEALEREIKELKVKLDRQIKEKQLSDQRNDERSARSRKKIRAQYIKIKEWKRKYFRMKGAPKIQEELLALRTNRTGKVNGIEKEVNAFKEQIHAREEELRLTGYEFEDREEELEDELALAEKGTDDEDEDDDDDDNIEYYLY